MECIGLHDFHPSDPTTELGFKKGDKLLLLNYGDNVQWYSAQLGRQTGLIPANYLKITKPVWFFGRLARIKAEQILMGTDIEGAFLVRLSESSPSDFSLSVKCGQSVQHFRILKNEENMYHLWSPTFISINELVQHYKNNTVSRTSHILLRDINPQDQFIVEAMYDFTPQNDAEGDTELGFKVGDLITVFDQSDINWWGGTLNGNSGFFPKLYVKPYEPNP